jgi:hypothetical protein
MSLGSRRLDSRRERFLTFGKMGRGGVIDLVRKPNHTPPLSTSDLCNCEEVLVQ